MFWALHSNQQNVDARRNGAWQTYIEATRKIENENRNSQNSNFNSVVHVIDSAKKKGVEEEIRAEKEVEQKLSARTAEFHKVFPPSEFEKEFFRIYGDEPQIDNFLCKEDNPTSVRISDLVY